MGLKSGSRDSTLGDDNNNTDDEDTETVETEPVDSEPTNTDSVPAQASSDDRLSADEIPYILRRENVNGDREQVPFFLRPSVLDAEEQFESEVEEMLGESVYKSDYREASIIAAQRNPDLIVNILREMGYDLD